MTARRRIALASGLLAVAAFAWSSVRTYQASRAPESHPDAPPARLNAAADDLVTEALAELARTDGDVAARFRNYRRLIERAEPLLTRSVAVDPAQPDALARLAGLRWELAAPLDEAGVERILGIVQVASSLAPRVPDVQLRLGELLLRMGRNEEAASYFRAAVKASADRADDAVRVLRRFGIPAADIAAMLPRVPETIAALYAPYFEDGIGPDYVPLAEAALPGHLPLLARCYGSACLRTSMAERLVATLTALGPQKDAAAEANRLIQLARAALATQQPEDGLRDARRAVELAPAESWIAESAGQVHSAAGKFDDAIAFFRRSLAIAAERKGADDYRASLYVQIALCEERRDRPDLAYDNYRRALASNPDRKDAADRLRRIEEKTGLKR